MNAISESNHTCALVIFLFSAPFQRLLFQLNGTLDRKSKILIALDDRESIVKYLADMPVGLMPDMSAFIQREGDEMQSMNIMYTAMRWCNMPAFFSFRHCVSSNSKRKRDDKTDEMLISPYKTISKYDVLLLSCHIIKKSVCDLDAPTPRI